MAVHPESDDIFPTSPIEKAESLLAKERARDGRNFIDTLPSELLSKVHRHLLDYLGDVKQFGIGLERELAPFILARISKRWRSVVLEDTSLFGSFVLGPEDKEKKVETMLENGLLREIWIGTGCRSRLGG